MNKVILTIIVSLFLVGVVSGAVFYYDRCSYPVLEDNNKVIEGSNNILNHLNQIPYFSKMPTSKDKLIGERQIGNIGYEVWIDENGNKFLGRDIKSIIN